MKLTLLMLKEAGFVTNVPFLPRISSECIFWIAFVIAKKSYLVLKKEKEKFLKKDTKGNFVLLLLRWEVFCIWLKSQNFTLLKLKSDWRTNIFVNYPEVLSSDAVSSLGSLWECFQLCFEVVPSILHKKICFFLIQNWSWCLVFRNNSEQIFRRTWEI